MKVQYTLIAIALGAIFATSAFAQGDDADIYSNTYLNNDVDVSGSVEVRGNIRVNSESSAIVDQDQITQDNWSLGDGDHDADMTDNALNAAQGNVGVNVATGVGNAQANDTALSSVDGERVFASAMVFSNQASYFNYASSNQSDTYYSATLDGDALADAMGNIGVNVAAGVGNGQTNAMAASVNSSGTIATATADSEQDAWMNTLATDYDLDTFATLGSNALSNAQGNIGANVAAGVGNLQHNGLSIATASCGTCD